MKNTQKGFLGVGMLIILGLVLIGGGSYVYLNTAKEKNIEEAVVENSFGDSGGETPVVKENEREDRVIPKTQIELTKVLTHEEQYSSYLQGGAIPEGWVLKSIKGENRTVTYVVPVEYQSEISASLINKPIDAEPDDWSLESIGGSVLGLKQLTVGNRKVNSYSFVSATNYGWDMYEVELDVTSHVEFGNTGKGMDKVTIPAEIWNEIVGSIRII